MVRRTFPLMANSAEQLVAALCLRRNMMTFPAPPRNEGYDLVCTHPDPRKVTKAVRLQVKSRYASDCNEAFDFNPKSLGSFDFLAAVFLNTGYYYRRKKTQEGLKEPEVFLLPHEYVREHVIVRSTRSTLFVRRSDKTIARYRCPSALEAVAKVLKVPYPA
jgi:hypothetical protein